MQQIYTSHSINIKCRSYKTRQQMSYWLTESNKRNKSNTSKWEFYCPLQFNTITAWINHGAKCTCNKEVCSLRKNWTQLEVYFRKKPTNNIFVKKTLKVAMCSMLHARCSAKANTITSMQGQFGEAVSRLQSWWRNLWLWVQPCNPYQLY